MMRTARGEAGMHTPVLLQEALTVLALRKGDVFLDATVGGGGHSAAVCRELQGDVTVIGLDADGSAVERSRGVLVGLCPRLTLVKANFRSVRDVLARAGAVTITKALLDLGMSSDELSRGGRGFSFLRDEPLRMTFDDAPSEHALTARDVVNEWARENLELIIRTYGEERYARRIAEGIVAARARKPIETSSELSAVIERAVSARRTGGPASYRRGRIHPATRTFQAIRMAVNDELSALAEGLRGAFEELSTGGRMAVISFHSLEDRVVKRMFRDLAKEGRAALLSKKPITPGAAEIAANPRARSAKLRGVEKINA